MDKFYNHVVNESKIISEMLSDDQDMYPLTVVQQGQHNRSTTCWNAVNHLPNLITKSDITITLPGSIFPTCNKCKFTLNMPNRKCKAMQGHGTEKKAKLDPDRKKIFLPIVFHNLKSYDAHFINTLKTIHHMPQDETWMTLRTRTLTWPTVTSA